MVSTRLLFVSVVFLVLALALSTSAAAEKTAKSDKVVRIGSISTIKNSGLIAVVNLEANQKLAKLAKLADSKLTVSVPELGLRSRHNVDFSKKQKQVAHLEIQYPSGLDPYIRIVFSSDEGRRVKYRPVIT